MRRIRPALVLALAAAGCVIILEPDEPPPPPPPDPPPIGGGGGPPVCPPACGPGTGDPVPAPDAGVPIGFPGSGAGGDPGLAVLWVVRIDRGTTFLAEPIERLVHTATASLVAAGFAVRAVGVMPMDAPSLAWAWVRGPREPAPLGKALQAAAQAVPAPFHGCPTSGLANSCRSLAGQQWGGHAPFAVRPGALLVAFVDPVARDVEATDPACAPNGAAAAWFAGSDPASWICLYGGALARRATRFWFVATPEGVITGEQLRQGCQEEPGFPSGVLDALEPSRIPFFSTLATRMNVFAATLASRADLCGALGSRWGATSRTLADAWIRELRGP